MTPLEVTSIAVMVLQTSLQATIQLEELRALRAKAKAEGRALTMAELDSILDKTDAEIDASIDQFRKMMVSGDTVLVNAARGDD